MTAAHNPPGPNFKTGPLGWGRPSAASSSRRFIPVSLETSADMERYT
jgi:hypothetical protein